MRCFIGLGSNLESPQQQINTAIQDIDSVDDVAVVNRSSLYKSPPMGPQDQPDYINAVIEVETTLSAHDLLDSLQAIEQQHGRVRKRHWGERTLDLDILLYGQQLISDERLTVPHQGIAERAFVIYPLAEIAAELMVPEKGIVAELMHACPADGLEKLEHTK